jgi:hypothetical protein
MYMDVAGDEDKKMADSWTADADGIQFFVSPISPCYGALKIDVVP